MNTPQRINPFGGINDNEPQLDDLTDFQPKSKGEKKPTVSREVIEQIAEQHNFPSREPTRPAKEQDAQVPAAEQTPIPSKTGGKPAAPKKPNVRRRHTTGRTEQVNLKATKETVEQLVRLAEAERISFAELFERALSALEREIAKR